MWLRAQPANQNLKQNVRTQDAVGMQALSVLNMRVKEFISTIILLIGEGVQTAGPQRLLNYVCKQNEI